MAKKRYEADYVLNLNKTIASLKNAKEQAAQFDEIMSSIGDRGKLNELIKYFVKLDDMVDNLRQSTDELMSGLGDSLKDGYIASLDGVFDKLAEISKVSQNVFSGISKIDINDKNAGKQLAQYATQLNLIFDSLHIAEKIDLEKLGTKSLENQLQTIVGYAKILNQEINTSLGDIDFGKIEGAYNPVKQFSAEVQAEIDKLEEQNKRLEKVKKDLLKNAQIFDEVSSGKKGVIPEEYHVDLQKDTAAETIKNLIGRYDELKAAMDSSEKSSVEYYDALLQLTDVSLKLRSVFEQSNMDKDLREFLNGQGLYQQVSKYGGTVFGALRKGQFKDDNIGQIDTIVQLNKERVDDIKYLESITDPVEKSLREITILTKKLENTKLGTKEYDELENKINSLQDSFIALYQIQEDALSTKNGYSLADLGIDEETTQEIIDHFKSIIDLKRIAAGTGSGVAGGSGAGTGFDAVDQAKKHAVGAAEYIEGMTFALKQLFDVMSKPMETEYKILINGQDINIKKGQFEEIDTKTLAEAYLSNLDKDAIVSAHSHMGRSSHTNQFDFRNAIDDYYLQGSKISAIIGKDDIATFNLAGVALEDAEVALKKIEEHVNKFGSADVKSINKIFQSINPNYTDVAKSWKPEQFGDFAKYIYDIGEKSEAALTPVERFQNVLKIFAQSIDLSKYQSLIGTVTEKNAGKIFNQIMESENIKSSDGNILQVDNIKKGTLTDVISDIKAQQEAYVKLREEAKVTYDDIASAAQKYLDTRHTKNKDAGLLKQYFSASEFAEIDKMFEDIAFGERDLIGVTNAIASRFGIDIDDMAVPMREVGDAVQDTSAKLQEMRNLADDISGKFGADMLDDVSIGQYQEKLRQAREELKLLAEQGIITANELEEVDQSLDVASHNLDIAQEENENKRAYKNGQYHYSYELEYEIAENENKDLRNDNDELKEKNRLLEEELEAKKEIISANETAKQSLEDELSQERYLSDELGQRAIEAEFRADKEKERAELLEQQNAELREQLGLEEQISKNNSIDDQIEATNALLNKQKLTYEDILTLVNTYHDEAQLNAAYAAGDWDTYNKIMSSRIDIAKKLVPQSMMGIGSDSPDKWLSLIGVSAEDAAQKLYELYNRVNALDDAYDGLVDTTLIDDEELDDIQKENGALEDRLEVLRDIADMYGVQITQKDRNRYEELADKDNEDGLTSKEAERFDELGEKIEEADYKLEEFEETYERIILKLSSGKKIEILPDDKGLRDLYKISDEYGTYNGHEIEDIKFIRHEISSYEELADLVARYNKLRNLKTKFTARQDAENDYVVNKLSKAAQDKLSETWDSNYNINLEKLAEILGFKIPQAAEKAEQAIEEVAQLTSNIVPDEAKNQNALFEDSNGKMAMFEGMADDLREAEVNAEELKDTVQEVANLDEQIGIEIPQAAVQAEQATEDVTNEVYEQIKSYEKLNQIIEEHNEIVKRLRHKAIVNINERAAKYDDTPGRIVDVLGLDFDKDYDVISQLFDRSSDLYNQDGTLSIDKLIDAIGVKLPKAAKVAEAALDEIKKETEYFGTSTGQVPLLENMSGELQTVEEKLKSFLIFVEEISENPLMIEKSDVELGKYEQQLQSARQELIEFGNQHLLTTEQIEQMEFEYSCAMDRIELSKQVHEDNCAKLIHDKDLSDDDRSRVETMYGQEKEKTQVLEERVSLLEEEAVKQEDLLDSTKLQRDVAEEALKQELVVNDILESRISEAELLTEQERNYAKLLKLQNEELRKQLELEKQRASNQGAFTESPHFVTDQQGKPVTMYRGIHGAYGGLVSNRYHGGTFSTDNLELAKEYAGVLGKVEKIHLSMKNPFEVDGDGALWNQIDYIGESTDKTSKKLYDLKEELRFVNLELKRLDESVPDPMELELVKKGLILETDKDKRIRSVAEDKIRIQSEIDAIFADDSNPYGKKTTNEIVEIAKENGYDGVIFKNIIDSATGQIKDLSNVMVTFTQDQIHYIETISATFEAAIDAFTKRFKFFTDNVDVTSDEIRNTMKTMIALKQKVDAGDVASDEYDKFIANNNVAQNITKFASDNKYDAEYFSKALNGDNIDLSFFMERVSMYLTRMRNTLQEVAKAFNMEDVPLANLLTTDKLKLFDSSSGQFDMLEGMSEAIQKAEDNAEELKDTVKEIAALDEKISLDDIVDRQEIKNIQDAFEIIEDGDRSTVKLLTTAETVQEALQKIKNALPDEYKYLSKYLDDTISMLDMSSYPDGNKITASMSTGASLGPHSEAYTVRNLGDGQVEVTLRNLELQAIAAKEVNDELREQEDIQEKIAQTDKLDDNDVAVVKQENAELEEQKEIIEDISNTDKLTGGKETSIDNSHGGYASEGTLQTTNKILGSIDGKLSAYGTNNDENVNLDAASLSAAVLEKASSIYGSDIQLGAFTKAKDGFNQVTGAFKNAQGVWEGFTAKVNDANKVVKIGVQQQSAFAKALNEANNATQQNVKKDKSVYGASKVTRAQQRYNVLSNKANMYVDPNSNIYSSEVEKRLNAYKNALTALQNSYQKLHNTQGLSKDDINALEAEFDVLQNGCMEAASALDKLLKASQKLKDGGIKHQILEAGQYDVDSAAGRQQALQDYVNNLGKAVAAVGQFNLESTELDYTIRNNDGTMQRFVATLDSTGTAIVSVAGKTDKATSFMSSLFDEFGKKSKEIFTYLAARFGIDEVFQQLRNGVQYVREIDSALTELKKVTNETDATYQRFLQDMSKTAGVVGSTVAELTTMSAEWARLGYNIKDSAKLAESTAVLLNVSEFKDATEASEALISTMQAFQYTANESQHVVDILNEVGKLIARR